jgi:hypothetical protein
MNLLSLLESLTTTSAKSHANESVLDLSRLAWLVRFQSSLTMRASVTYRPGLLAWKGANAALKRVAPVGCSGVRELPARRAASTCIIGQSSGCPFLSLFAPAAAQALGSAYPGQRPPTLATSENYNNSNRLRNALRGAMQLARGLRHLP